MAPSVNTISKWQNWQVWNCRNTQSGCSNRVLYATVPWEETENKKKTLRAESRVAAGNVGLGEPRRWGLAAGGDGPRRAEPSRTPEQVWGDAAACSACSTSRTTFTWHVPRRLYLGCEARMRIIRFRFFYACTSFPSWLWEACINFWTDRQAAKYIYNLASRKIWFCLVNRKKPTLRRIFGNLHSWLCPSIVTYCF